jgi:glycosyltransferase involved in cell wall biosynthesis
MKVLVLWSGAVVPAYQQFFHELAKHMQVRVLSPKKWKHGSVVFAGSSEIDNVGSSATIHGASPCEIIPTTFWPEDSSKYWVPSLIFHLWSFRPQYLYIMDEMDRLSFTWHSLSAKVFWPPVRIACYALQNLAKPKYYRWHHKLALSINQKLVSKGIAASEEASQVLHGHGYRGPSRVIPLWGSENIFYPGEKSATVQFRHRLSIPNGSIVLLFCGGLVAAKGLLLLIKVLPRFPHIQLVTAGQGPLQKELAEKLGHQCINLGALTGDDLRSFFQAGDYLILPSITLNHWKEQIGRTLIEGILCGCIALGSDSGNIPALTIFPETTFSQGDEEALATLLARLPLAEAETIRSTQRKNVDKHFTAKSVAIETYKFLSAAQ